LKQFEASLKQAMQTLQKIKGSSSEVHHHILKSPDSDANPISVEK